MNIRVKSLSHYGFVSRRREVSGGQMEVQILCSQCAELGNGSEVPGGGICCQKSARYPWICTAGMSTCSWHSDVMSIYRAILDKSIAS